MSDPDEIRAEIERTRGDLGSDVDALAAKVRPSSIAHRQTEKVKSRFSSMRESVMGSVSSAGSTGRSGVDAAKDAGHTAVEQAKGNALAVGLIAFGAGWLVSSLIPASGAERQVAETAKEKAQPLLHEAQEAAKESAEHLKEPAKEAAQAVKERAADAASTVKDEARDSASDVRDSAQEQRDRVQGY